MTGCAGPVTTTDLQPASAPPQLPREETSAFREQRFLGQLQEFTDRRRNVNVAECVALFDPRDWPAIRGAYNSCVDNRDAKLRQTVVLILDLFQRLDEQLVNNCLNPVTGAFEPCGGASRDVPEEERSTSAT